MTVDSLETAPSVNCPLCRSRASFDEWEHEHMKQHAFLHCPVCDVVFVPAAQQVTLEEEKARYLTHDNSLEAKGFREFLMTTVEAIRERIPNSARTLDLGSGPEPSMSVLLREAGYDVTSYDPFFAPALPEGAFDLILIHEVFEHFREPATELDRVEQWLNTGGTLLIRSELRRDAQAFRNWWYPRDYTHILFPSATTLEWVAANRNWKLEFWSEKLWAFRV